MITRLLVAVAVTCALVVLPAVPAGAIATTSGTWFCIGVEHLDVGICQGNPLPRV